MPIAKTPYEFLVRFKQDGSISGAHIKFLETISEGGVVLLQREGKAEPVETANESGFPMASILDLIHVGAISAFDAEVVAHTTTKAERDELTGKVQQLEGVVATAEMRLDAAIKEITQLQQMNAVLAGK